MRFKIGDRWHTPTPDAPLMVEMTAEERARIASGETASRGNTRYAHFAIGDARTPLERNEWMDGGASAHGGSDARELMNAFRL